MGATKIAKHQDCSRCSRRHGEAFWCFRNRYIFDVDMAREIVADGREKMELEPDDIQYSIDHCEINEGHLAHVDPRIPGIVAHIYFPHDGDLIHCHRLIDGHHRAARCVRAGMPFHVYVLSEAESIQVLMRAPKTARPGKRRRKALAEAAT
jgi:hypothetical protein